MVFDELRVPYFLNVSSGGGFSPRYRGTDSRLRADSVRDLDTRLPAATPFSGRPGGDAHDCAGATAWLGGTGPGPPRNGGIVLDFSCRDHACRSQHVESEAIGHAAS